MPVYVDQLMNHGWKLGHSCHMWADTDEELLLMAAKVGLRPDWIQRVPPRRGCSRGFTHFDLVGSKRQRAVLKGAIELTSREAVIMWRKMDILPEKTADSILGDDNGETVQEVPVPRRVQKPPVGREVLQRVRQDPSAVQAATDLWIPEKEEERLQKERESFEWTSRPAAFLDFRCQKCKRSFGCTNQEVIRCPHCGFTLPEADRKALDEFIALLGVSTVQKALRPAPSPPKRLKAAAGVKLAVKKGQKHA